MGHKHRRDSGADNTSGKEDKPVSKHHKKEKKEKERKSPSKSRSPSPKPTTPVVAPTPTPAPVAPAQPAITHEDLHCVVCLDLPDSLQIYQVSRQQFVFSLFSQAHHVCLVESVHVRLTHLPSFVCISQCRNGHIMCSSCHERIVQGPKAACPTCRMKLGRVAPFCRNMLAEKVLAKIPMDCPNDGCTAKVEFRELNHHKDHVCPFRKLECKYKPLGCDVRLTPAEMEKHTKECPLKSKTGSKLLKSVMRRFQEKEEEAKKLRQRMTASEAVCEAMQKYCRDIEVSSCWLWCVLMSSCSCS